jgi:hypothetical protein
MAQLTMEVEIKTSDQSYSSAALRDQVAVAPYSPDYKRDGDSKHDAAARIVFLAATLQAVLTEGVLEVLGAMARELAPSEIVPPAQSNDGDDDDEVEVEDTRDLKRAYRSVTFMLKGDRDEIAKFTSTLDIQTDRNLDRDRTLELIGAVTQAVRARVTELLVLNEIIAALPDDPRTAFSPDVQAAVDESTEARSRAWQLQERLEALRRAKEARARAQQLEDEIRAEFAPAGGDE